MRQQSRITCRYVAAVLFLLLTSAGATSAADKQQRKAKEAEAKRKVAESERKMKLADQKEEEAGRLMRESQQIKGEVQATQKPVAPQSE